MHAPCSLNIDVEWQTLKNTLQQAANEAPGKRKKRRHKRRLILWNENIKNLNETRRKLIYGIQQHVLKQANWNTKG